MKKLLLVLLGVVIGCVGTAMFIVNNLQVVNADDGWVEIQIFGQVHEYTWEEE